MELRGTASFWTDYAKDTLFAPALSKLSLCGAEVLPLDIPASDHWLSDFILNTTFTFPLADPTRQLAFALLREVDRSIHEFERGRAELEGYLAEGRPTRLIKYSRALGHFETCLAAVWLAWSLVKRLLPKGGPLFEPGDDSEFERIYRLHNASKHADGHLASGRHARESTLHIWITDSGLEGVEARVGFAELAESICALYRMASAIANPKPPGAT